MNTQAPIPVNPGYINDKPCLVVDARQLHAFLEVGKVFAAWINERIQQYSFTAKEDYELLLSNSGKQSRGGHNAKDYTLSLDMAKELAMVERNAKGREARRYFIACERQLHTLTAAPALPASDTTPTLTVGTMPAALDLAYLRELKTIDPALARAYILEAHPSLAGHLAPAAIPSPSLGQAEPPEALYHFRASLAAGLHRIVPWNEHKIGQHPLGYRYTHPERGTYYAFNLQNMATLGAPYQFSRVLRELAEADLLWRDPGKWMRRTQGGRSHGRGYLYFVDAKILDWQAATPRQSRHTQEN